MLRAARAELAASTKWLLALGLVVLGLLIMANLPWWPPYEQGLLTGALMVGVLWTIAWTTWVTSGLSHRLNGVWAEEVTNEELRKHRNTLGLMPNYKFEGWDIDSILVTRAAVYAVECKWRGSVRGETDFHYELLRVAKRLQRNVVALRTEMVGLGVPQAWIRGVIVLRGPAARGFQSRLLDLPDGSRVRVVSSDGLSAWMDGQGRGMVGPDFAETLIGDLERLNADQEDQVEAGPILRWLARVR